jgi:hypothetical protein
VQAPFVVVKNTLAVMCIAFTRTSALFVAYHTHTIRD